VRIFTVHSLRWAEQRPGERLLRLFLGATFLYAGAQKLADPGFLREGSATYIGSQLEGFAQNSPVEPVLNLLAEAPVAVGIATALTEILIGVATLAGVLPSLAALGGALLAATLWLSTSWSVYPYYLGPDSIYLVAWLAYLLSLPGTARAWRAVQERLRPATATPDTTAGGLAATADLAPQDPVDDARRSMLRGGAVVGGSLAIAGAAGLRGWSRGDAGSSAANAAASTPGPTAAATPGATSGATGPVVADVQALARDGAVEFTDTELGDAVAVALPGAAPVAFSSRCTHSGCTVRYDAGTRLLVCPCHNSHFDPANGGSAVQGPATRALDPIPVVLDPSTGLVRRG
jgi:thiosulfate dehydrogenase (quinone) large subunit